MRCCTDQEWLLAAVAPRVPGLPVGVLLFPPLAGRWALLGSIRPCATANGRAHAAESGTCRCPIDQMQEWGGAAKASTDMHHGRKRQLLAVDTGYVRLLAGPTRATGRGGIALKVPTGAFERLELVADMIWPFPGRLDLTHYGWSA
jgi:hypothetical protein